MLLRSSSAKDCSTESDFALTIPMGKCLNNHDFSKVACDKLQACLLRVPKGGLLPYEDLVQCSGAPSMPLSVFQEVDATTGRLRALVYPLSRTCSDIPIVMHFAKQQCASLFAVSKQCGIAGAAVDW
jgi:hypothetical protein